MAIDLSEIVTEETTLRPQQIVNGNGTSSIAYLNELRDASLASVDNIAENIRASFGLTSETNRKGEASANEKCRRPELLRKYPWFQLCHIRDYLRFRTSINRIGDFENVLRFFALLQDKGEISIVKIDTSKLDRPGAFGWRMIAVDIRIRQTGMLVEHYMTFAEMIEVNQAWLHEVYETWRALSTDDSTPDELRQMYRDQNFSTHAYRELYFDGILRDRPASSKLSIHRSDAQNAISNELLATLNLDRQPIV